MGLFDVKQEAAKGVRNNQVSADPYEDELRSIKARRARAVMQLGEMTYENNRDSDMSDTVYADLYEAISTAEADFELCEKKQLASKGLRRCEECGAELPINSGFCNKCGAKQGDLESEVVMASHICPKCGSRLEDGDMFCVSCGYKL